MIYIETTANIVTFVCISVSEIRQSLAIYIYTFIYYERLPYQQ